MTKDQTDRELCNRSFEWCTTDCKYCHEVATLNKYGDIFVCSKHWVEVLPKELDLTRGVGQ
jgi:hypothetical protein